MIKLKAIKLEAVNLKALEMVRDPASESEGNLHMRRFESLHSVRFVRVLTCCT
jgi:hypothetical protein